ncbi:(2Fe-2S)-binding protein [Photobacterium jeanii]|uniref:(2Fe-2S)-binding protein n=1 Tax=Photobacterium jeanii TaxID=858640 RepID=A0A178KNR5_9GAMM|nr:class I ribonucleotide reductase maintenance protein YfaE [Photobacterium jeanii]OAN18313.1 (2Fe-2S)-binding protein [Photobacterium jeanii]PST92007.1 (2Fe-2S)-binding protein [Photobacterium jeanii]
MSSLTITVNGIKVHGNSREPLLTQLERVGIQPEYQCRNGMCGACRCKLQTGAVDQQDAMAFVGQNEILSCCSIPKANVTIEFDYQVVTAQQVENASNS